MGNNPLGGSSGPHSFGGYAPRRAWVWGADMGRVGPPPLRNYLRNYLLFSPVYIGPCFRYSGLGYR